MCLVPSKSHTLLPKLWKLLLDIFFRKLVEKLKSASLSWALHKVERHSPWIWNLKIQVGDRKYNFSITAEVQA